MRKCWLLLLCYPFWHAPLAASAAIADAGVQVSRSWEETPGVEISASDILRVKDLGGVAAAPGGRYVAFVVREADASCDCHHQSLHLLDRRDGTLRVIADLGPPFLSVDESGSTLGLLMSAQPLWSPDGRQLAYIANRAGKAVLVLWEPQNWRESVSMTSDEVLGFVWGDSGETLIYLTGGPNPTVAESVEEGYRSGFLYGPQFMGVAPGRLPIAPRVPVKLHWGPTDNVNERAALSTLKVLITSSGQTRSATEQERLRYERSGASSAYLSLLDPETLTLQSADKRYRIDLGYASPGYRRAVSIQELRTPQRPAKQVDKLCAGTITDAYWDDRGRSFILVCASDYRWIEGSAEFIRVDPSTGRGETWFDIFAPGIFDGRLGRTCDLSDGDMICVHEEPSSPPSLVAISAGGKRRTLVDPNSELRNRHRVHVEELKLKNDFGAGTWAFLVYPRDYSSRQRYPLVVVQYNASGFLRGGTGNEYPILAIAESGFFVLNIRHPRPVAEDPKLTHVETNAAQWRENKWRRSIQSSIDIAIEDLDARGLIDAGRVAYTGFSGGANQIDYALANGRRIAVAISSTCCVGPEAWPATAASLMHSMFLKVTNFGDPAQECEYQSRWTAVSPSMHVNSIHTAILANMSETEMLQATALWYKMRSAHRPMEVYVYPNSFHVKGRPVQRAAIYRRNLDWLRFWLQDYEDPSESKRGQYLRWRALRDEWRKSDVNAGGGQGTNDLSIAPAAH